MLLTPTIFKALCLNKARSLQSNLARVLTITILILLTSAPTHAQTVGLRHGQALAPRGASSSVINNLNPVHVKYYGGPVISDVHVVVVIWSSDVEPEVVSNIG